MMEQIALPSEMMSQVRRLAFQEKRSVEAVVAEAIQEHLEMMAEAKIDQEIALFEQQHPLLVQKYLGQVVAIHEGQVVDTDSDFELLFLRVQGKFPNIPILFRLVTDVAETEFRGRVPSMQTNGS